MGVWCVVTWGRDDRRVLGNNHACVYTAQITSHHTDISTEEVFFRVRDHEYEDLYKYDQLNCEREAGNVFQEFEEGVTPLSVVRASEDDANAQGNEDPNGAHSV